MRRGFPQQIEATDVHRKRYQVSKTRTALRSGAANMNAKKIRFIKGRVAPQNGAAFSQLVSICIIPHVAYPSAWSVTKSDCVARG
jgi:hypothetical protein